MYTEEERAKWRLLVARWKAGEKVFDAGKRVEKTDATTVQRQEPVQPIKRNFIAEAQRKHAAEAVGPDTRSSYQRKQSLAAKLYANQQYQKAKDDAKRAEGLELMMKTVSPSTYIEAATGQDLGEAGRFVTDAAMIGSGLILKNVANVAKTTYRKFAVKNAFKTAINENPVITAYNRNPATKDLGTLWNYQSYLDEVFPNSKIKSILWHGSKVKGLQSFSTDAIGSHMPIKGSVGMYLAPERATAANYGSKGDVYPVLLNSENPFITDQILGLSKHGVNVVEISPKIRNTVLAKNDAVIAPARGEIAFFEPDNALILGSNRDLRGFGNFMRSNSVRLGMFPKKAATITTKNAASMTPEQWTVTQDAAIARGDIAEAQRLRDLHFKISASNTTAVNELGNPVHNYHGTTNTFTTFNPQKIGSTTGDKSGFFFTDNKSVANFYSHETGSAWNNLKLMLGLYRGHKPQIYDVYLNTIKPMITDFHGGVDKVGREILAKEAIKNGNDANILQNIIDGPPALPHNVTIMRNPKHIKLADAVTYDNNGVRIPLGKRDNFNINDIRYGIIPLISGSTGYGLYNKYAE